MGHCSSYGSSLLCLLCSSSFTSRALRFLCASADAVLRILHMFFCIRLHDRFNGRKSARWMDTRRSAASVFNRICVNWLSEIRPGLNRACASRPQNQRTGNAWIIAYHLTRLAIFPLNYRATERTQARNASSCQRWRQRPTRRWPHVFFFSLLRVHRLRQSPLHVFFRVQYHRCWNWFRLVNRIFGVVFLRQSVCSVPNA